MVEGVVEGVVEDMMGSRGHGSCVHGSGIFCKKMHLSSMDTCIDLKLFASLYAWN